MRNDKMRYLKLQNIKFAFQPCRSSASASLQQDKSHFVDWIICAVLKAIGFSLAGPSCRGRRPEASCFRHPAKSGRGDLKRQERRGGKGSVVPLVGRPDG